MLYSFYKKSGNKHYTDVQTPKEFESKCRQKDPIGYNLIFGDDEEYENARHNAKPRFIFYPDGSVDPILELQTFLELKEQDIMEQNYRESDVI